MRIATLMLIGTCSLLGACGHAQGPQKVPAYEEVTHHCKNGVSVIYRGTRQEIERTPEGASIACGN